MNSDKLFDFINSNEDLVNDFYNITGYSLEDCEDEINCAYHILKKDSPHINFEDVLFAALTNVIDDGTNLWDELNSQISDDIIPKDESKDDKKEEEEIITFNSTQQYFKEINDIYNKNNNDYEIVYCPENRNKLIEMNLKTVVSIAKKYQGLGLTLNELISAGNLGLVIAYDKFDPSRSKLKDEVIESLNILPDSFEYKDLYEILQQYLTYGDIKKKFSDKFKIGYIYKKKDVLRWINMNISNAKFNSIATMWIRAYILIEIDNNSRIVKKPKSEIYKDKEKEGSYKREVVVDIDAPVNNESDTTIGDLLYIEDNSRSDLDIGESYDIFKDNLAKLLDGVKTRDRSILLKKFGIGLPRPMLPKEIAEQEGLSIARISQIFQTVIEQMQINQAKYNVDPHILFEAVKNFQ